MVYQIGVVELYSTSTLFDDVRACLTFMVRHLAIQLLFGINYSNTNSSKGNIIFTTRDMTVSICLQIYKV